MNFKIGQVCELPVAKTTADKIQYQQISLNTQISYNVLVYFIAQLKSGNFSLIS